jgi:hypothetical protein
MEQRRPQVTIWRIRIACWIPKATNTRTCCVVLIVFPHQKWLYERVSMLCYACIDCLVHGMSV